MFGNSLEQRALFFRELATMLVAGITLMEALYELRERVQGARLRAAVEDAYQSVRVGQPLSKAMARHPQVFTNVERSLIETAEESGHMEEMVEQIARYLEQEHRFMRMVARETLYPKVVLVVFIAFLIFMPSVPAFFGTGGSFEAGMGVILQGVLFWVVVALALVGLWYLLKALIKQNDSLGRAVDVIKLKMPIMGGVVRRLAVARFSRALAALYGAGVGVGKAVEVAAGTINNQVLVPQMRQASRELQEGKGIADSLGKIPDMDSLAVRMLRTGEQTGNLDASMERVADSLEATAESTIHKATVLLLPVAITILAIFVLLQVISFYVGYFQGILGE
jgi:type IV pilus assembly protein PilC